MSGKRPHPGGESYTVPLALLAALAVPATTLLAGPVAAWLSGRGRVTYTADPGTTALTALVDGPAAAFDPDPPTWLFWLLLAALWGAAMTAGVWAWARLGTPRAGGAQWGGAKVERKLAAKRAPAQRVDRLTGGRGQHTKRILAAEPCISATAFGVPGSGKTTGLLLPNAAEWSGPVVMTTTKASDLDAVYARRAALGPVWVIAPAGIPGRATARWSPVDYCTDAKAADRMAGWLADASTTGGDKRAAPWVEQAKSVLKGVLLAANLSGGGITAFRRWLTLGKDAVDPVRAILLNAGWREVADDYASPWQRLHEDGIGSIQFTLNTLVRVYADEEVRETSSHSDFTAEEFLDQCGTVCLVASESDAERFAPLLTAITASIVHGAEMRYNATGRPLSPALGLLIDEAGNMFRYPKLPNLLTTGRGMGIDVLTIWHDLSQLREQLGTQKAGTVLSASGMRMLLPGCGDLETLKYFSGLYGRTEAWRTSTTRSSGTHSTQTSTVETDLAPVHSLQQLPTGTAILQYSNLPPVKIRLRLTYRDRDLKRLLAAPKTPPPADAAALDKTPDTTNEDTRV